MVKNILRSVISSEFGGIDFDILTPPDSRMGDYSINLAFILAKEDKKDPLEIGQKLADDFSHNEAFKK